MPRFYDGDDTESDGAKSAVQSAAAEAARSQGGTELTSISGAKGNSDPIDVEKSERVHSDPQGHQWYDVPRADRDNHNDPDSSEY